MGTCLFCDIAAGKIPCTQVHCDEKFLAFRDIDPKAPTHILIIPRKHVSGLTDLQESDRDLAGDLVLMATGIAAAEGLEKPAKLEKLHLYYGRNRGRALDGELVALLGRYLGEQS